MIVYPSERAEEIRDIIAYIKQDDAETGSVFLSHHCIGKHVWTLWQTDSYKFINLYHIIKDEERGWGYEFFMYEAQFEEHNCPRNYIEMTQDSPFKCEEWREKVKEFYEVREDIQDWKSVLKLFRKFKRKKSKKRIKIYFKGLYSKRGSLSEEIPFAIMENTFPFVGRYKGKLYSLKKRAITKYEVLDEPKHPRGLKES